VRSVEEEVAAAAQGMNRAKLEFMMRDINNVNSFEKNGEEFRGLWAGMPRACLWNALK
jgi:hypothetical protein